MLRPVTSASVKARPVTANPIKAPLDWSPALLGARRRVSFQPRGLVAPAGKITSWFDVVGGLNPAEAVALNQPTKDPAGFRGMIAADFNPSNSEKLTQLGGIAGKLNTGAEPGDHFFLVREDSPNTDPTRCIASYGTTAAAGRFSLTIVTVAGTPAMRRFSAAVGTGGGNLNARNDLVDAFGLHWVHVRIEADGVTIGVDGQYATKVAGVPAIGSDKLTLGCITNVTPGNFHNGVLNRWDACTILPPAELAQMQAWLTRMKNG